MTFPKARLAVSAVLFVSWLSFLGYLVFTSSKVILSRPQFLLAQLYVVAEVGSLHSEVTIAEVLWSARAADQALAGKTITLPELMACGKKQGNHGPGKYLLPLQRTKTDDLEIAPVPPTLAVAALPATHGTLESFGVFSHRFQRRLALDEAIENQQDLKAAGHVVYLTPEIIRIYPWNAGIRIQVEELIQSK